jgi:hypothetical protein
MGRFIDWLLYRNYPVMTGIYDRGQIYPHAIHPPVVVGAKVAPNALPPFDLKPGTRVFYHRKPSTNHRGQWVAFNVTPVDKGE